MPPEASEKLKLQVLRHTTAGFFADVDKPVLFDKSRGWTGYSESNTLDLTDTVAPYEFTFQMTKESDPEARFEFNVGTNTQKVWIGNVRLEKTPPPVEDPNADKTPLESGEMIYNGTFDQGDSSRMTYWNVDNAGADAGVQVAADAKELGFIISDGGATSDALMVNQKGLLVSKVGTYEVAFDARAAAARTIEVEIISRDGATSYSGVQTIALTQDMARKTFTFTMEHDTDAGSQLVFKAGGSNVDLVLDNVSMIKTGGNDYTGVDLFLLANGTFHTDTSSWDIWTGDCCGFGGTAEAVVDAEQLKLAVTAAGNETWSIQVTQGPLDLVQGIVYKVSFDARATVGRKIEVLAENATYYRHFSEEVALTETMQQYSYLFEMEADDTVTFKLLAGNVDNANTLGVHDIFIDNVTLEVASEVENGAFTDGTDPWALWYADWEIPAPVMTSENEELKVVVDQVGSASWSVQVYQLGVEFVNGDTYTVVFDAKADEARKMNLAVGKALDADPYFIPYVVLQTYDLGTEMQRYSVSFEMAEATYDNGKLVFELGNIAGGNAATTVYIDNVAVIHEGSTGPEEPPAGEPELIKNGGFDTDSSDWELWTGNQHGFGGIADITVESGVLNMTVEEAGNEAWSIQLTQGPIDLFQETMYQVSFDASSSIVRSLEVLLEDSAYQRYFSEEIELSTTMQHYEYQFTMETDAAVTFKFLLGDVAGAGELGAHTFQLDNVNLEIIHSIVPEPGTAVMLGVGVIGLLTVVRRRTRR